MLKLILLGSGLRAVSVFYRAFVLQYLWNWFGTLILHAPPAPYWAVVGIQLIGVSLFTDKMTEEEMDPTKSSAELNTKSMEQVKNIDIGFVLRSALLSDLARQAVVLVLGFSIKELFL